MIRRVLVFFERTAVGGVLFLLPVALVLFLLGQLFVMVRPAAAQMVGFIGAAEMGPFWLAAAIVLALVLAAFLAGLFAATAAGRALIDRLEALALNRVPGYSMIRSAAAEAASSMAAIDPSERRKAVLVGDGKLWQIGILTGQVDEQTFAIFIPEGPAAESGAVVFAGPDQFIDSGLTVSEALGCLRRLGADPPKISLSGAGRRMAGVAGPNA